MKKRKEPSPVLTYRGYYRESWDLLRRDPLAMISLVIVLLLVIVAVFAPLTRPLRSG